MSARRDELIHRKNKILLDFEQSHISFEIAILQLLILIIDIILQVTPADQG